MTDRELIRAYRHCYGAGMSHSCIKCPIYEADECGAVTSKAVLSRMEALLAENEHLREVAKMMPKWTSVSERLPENNDNQVLVVVNGIYGGIYFHDAVEIAEFVLDEGWILEGWPDWENPSVTYWQPLPAPPNTEGVE